MRADKMKVVDAAMVEALNRLAREDSNKIFKRRLRDPYREARRSENLVRSLISQVSQVSGAMAPLTGWG